MRVIRRVCYLGQHCRVAGNYPYMQYFYKNEAVPMLPQRQALVCLMPTFTSRVALRSRGSGSILRWVFFPWPRGEHSANPGSGRLCHSPGLGCPWGGMGCPFILCGLHSTSMEQWQVTTAPLTLRQPPSENCSLS